MRIGINASFLRKPGTGIGQVTLHFLKTLAETPAYAGHTFVLYLDEALGTCDWPKNFEQKVFLPFRKRDDVPRKLLWEWQLRREAKKDGCDAFISLYQSATVFPKNFRHIMLVHDLIPFLFPEYLYRMSVKVHAWFMKRGIRNAQLIAVSGWTKKDLIKFGIKPEKITVAHPSVSPHFLEPVLEEIFQAVLLKYGLEKGYIYHGGGLEIRKNTQSLLGSYAFLKRKSEKGEIPPLPKLVISGKVPVGHPLATDVESLIKELKLENDVRLLGFIPSEDLPALYKGAMMFVYPSLYEGFGMPVLEALSVGVPVITSRVSSLPEVGGDAVVYVDPKNTQELTLAMERLLSDRELRQELISKSKNQALQFSWQEFTDRIMTTVTQAL